MRAFVFLMVVVSFLISGCATEQDCLIADTIKELKPVHLNEGNRFLYLRTSGFSEKEHFFELFKGKATFDDCGQTTSTPIFQTHIDDTEGFPVKLLIADDGMTVEYATESRSADDLASIPVEIFKPAM